MAQNRLTHVGIEDLVSIFRDIITYYMNYNIFKSRTFWTFVAMFVIGGINAIYDVVPPSLQMVVQFGLAALGSYFHLDTAKKFGARN